MCFFHIGDTAELVDHPEAGYLITLLGRKSVDIIKSGGFKISALDIEQVLLSHPAVKVSFHNVFNLHILLTTSKKVPIISAYTWWNRQATNEANRDHYYRLSGFSASGQFAAAELILNSTTKPLRRRPDRTQLLLLLISGDIHPNPGPTTKYPCPVCTRDVTSRGVSYRCTRCTGWVHGKCSGLLNAAQYRRNKDWTCAPARSQRPSNQHHPHPHHLQPLLHLPIKLVMTARSTFYSSTLMESAAN